LKFLSLLLLLNNLVQSSGVTGVSPHYGLGQSFVTQQAAFLESWHSGHSPYRYELVSLPLRVQKCYGCGMEFANKYRQSPYNIVVKHVDRRLVRRDEQIGLSLYSADYSNTYYHLDAAHISRKNRFFNGNIYISLEERQNLDEGQSNVITMSNLNVVCLMRIVADYFFSVDVLVLLNEFSSLDIDFVLLK